MAIDVLTNLTNVTQSKYDRTIPLYQNNMTKLISMMDKGKIVSFDSEDYFKIPFQFKLPEGSCNSGEYDGTNNGFPTALSAGYLQLRMAWAKWQGIISLSEEQIDLTKGANVFVDGLRQNINGMLKVYTLDQDTDAHLSGDGRVFAATDAPTLQVIPIDYPQFARIGMVLDGYASTDHDADGVVVTKVDVANNTITVTGTVTAVDENTVFYKEGTHDGTSANASANGLSNIIDDDTGTFQNLSRDTYSYVQAVVKDGDSAGTAQAFTLTRLRQLLDAMMESEGAELPDVLYGSPGVRNAYIDTITDENVPNETIVKKAGQVAIPVYVYDDKAIEIQSSVRCIPNTMFALNKKHLLKYFGKFKWDKTGGLLKPTGSGAAFYAWCSAWQQFGTDFPKKNGRLNDITET